MARITLDIDDELHSKFKKYCIDKKLTMKSLLTTLVKRIVKKNGKKRITTR